MALPSPTGFASSLGISSRPCPVPPRSTGASLYWVRPSDMTAGAMGCEACCTLRRVAICQLCGNRLGLLYDDAVGQQVVGDIGMIVVPCKVIGSDDAWQARGIATDPYGVDVGTGFNQELDAGQTPARDCEMQ